MRRTRLTKRSVIIALAASVVIGVAGPAAVAATEAGASPAASALALASGNQARQESGEVEVWGTRGETKPQAGATYDDVKQVSGGENNSLALTTKGEVIGIGSTNPWGINNVPDEAKSGVDAIAASHGFSLALKGGKVIAWDEGNDYGEQKVPEEAKSGVTAIAAGAYHGLALKNGGVIAWGAEGGANYGQAKVPDKAKSGVKAIAAGQYFSLALKDNGEVVAWGVVQNSAKPVTVPDEALSGVKAISANCMGNHWIALKDDGSVISWGNYQDGNNTNMKVVIPDEAKSGVTAISTGRDASMAKKADGSLISWDNKSDTFKSAVIPDSSRYGTAAFSMGAYHAVVVKAQQPAGADAPVITKPEADSTQDKPQVQFEGTAAYDKGVTKVKLAEDGKEVRTVGVNAQGKWWISNNALPEFTEGSHTVTATSVTADGEGKSSEVTFEVKPQAQGDAPVIIKPEADSTQDKPQVKFEGTAANDKGVTKVKLTENGKEIRTVGVNSKNEWWISNDVLPEFTPGKHTVTATSITANGEGKSSEVTFNVAVDAGAPVITTPEANADLDDNRVKFEGTAAFDKGVKQVKLTEDGKEIRTVGVNAKGEWWIANNVLPTFTSGKHTVTATGITAEGQTTTTTVTFTVK